MYLNVRTKLRLKRLILMKFQHYYQLVMTILEKAISAVNLIMCHLHCKTQLVKFIEFSLKSTFSSVQDTTIT